MGTDNLHHKRKAKLNSDLKRKKAKREPYDRVLIVCEGEKTEPHYFSELKDHYRLNSANIKITGDCGSSPCSVLDKAEELQDQESKKGDAYDKIYCVLDKDCHTSYRETVSKINDLKEEGFEAVTSVPCFEYWLLLHFDYVTHPYCKTENKSICDKVIQELKLYLPDYEKGTSGLFVSLLDKMDGRLLHQNWYWLKQKEIIQITQAHAFMNWLNT
ncbi:MAG: RloB family protein [Thiomicrorhabdus sp.]|nr:RloB family protein [Thiomicrorhabdus sp.]